MTIRSLPVGEHGLLVELDSGEAAEALHAELLRRAAARRLPAVREIVPAARTVFLDGLADPGRLAAELPGWRIPPLDRDDSATVEVPVRYDGPDLAGVAELWGVTPEEAVRIHSATEFRVAFCGFAPGFGYLTGLPERFHVPRHATPRTRVPVGSVALAGAYTGVYPRSSPGGWQLIGTTDAVLWDTAREPAALFAPGTRVRFVPEPGTVLPEPEPEPEPDPDTAGTSPARPREPAPGGEPAPAREGTPAREGEAP
ncbi:allophanate hydrolase subunit 1 [Streptomyces sp. RKCA744]|uniref:5-oxoprolinase subunit B family protein n=1 Tax=Streptomyces sp. RKCA744 TaxID=2959340 RepID=UPI00209E3917|nr:allophanate hydrolase subunit 1 [Streptomyces sp. RKCA744]MCO8305720.1 allophanate hydrolase subunit 1 [Streptomyces sp. RKCA744]